MNTKIKICGITKREEVEMLLDNQVAYAGMVLFYPKSKRNNTLENAKILLEMLKDSSIETVAVTVSPTKEEIRNIQEVGFDYIQIHGMLSKESFDEIEIPILRAFNVTDLNLYDKYHKCHKVYGYVFDAAIPGSGKTFDWSMLDDIPRDEKLFILAGGLCKDNIEEAIKRIKPDVVDVSSGVEGESGKEASKIREFVTKVRQEKTN
ncbi:MAG: phosphoribosylanthranilate isomerase [Lachnotalea sp.]